MRRPDVRLVAVSSFTAGALVPWLHTWRSCRRACPGHGSSELARAATARAGHRGDDGPPGGDDRVPAPEDRRDKGLAQLLLSPTRRPRGGTWPPGSSARLTVCGKGRATPWLPLPRAHPWCTVRPGLPDRELAAQFAASDLFVLATRTRAGRRPCGEGFGLVLLEAQVADGRHRNQHGGHATPTSTGSPGRRQGTRAPPRSRACSAGWRASPPGCGRWGSGAPPGHARASPPTGTLPWRSTGCCDRLAAKREGGPLIAIGRPGDGEARQPARDQLAAAAQVGRARVRPPPAPRHRPPGRPHRPRAPGHRRSPRRR